MSAPGVNAEYFGPHPGPPAPERQEQGLINWNHPSYTVPKSVTSEGRNFRYITLIATYSNEASAALEDQISNLRRDYGFSDGAVVTNFLTTHRTIRAMLQDAVPQLRATFGQDRIFNLEVSKDEDGSETMYAVVIWPEDARCASEKLHEFLENWWLHRLNAATSDLAFTYKLV